MPARRFGLFRCSVLEISGSAYEHGRPVRSRHGHAANRAAPCYGFQATRRARRKPYFAKSGVRPPRRARARRADPQGSTRIAALPWSSFRPRAAWSALLRSNEKYAAKHSRARSWMSKMPVNWAFPVVCCNCNYYRGHQYGSLKSLDALPIPEIFWFRWAARLCEK